MRGWMTRFVYHTTIGIPLFLWGGGAALLVALLTVSFQSIRAACTDPAESLRYE
jgi:putative ABC transport system permease protein